MKILFLLFILGTCCFNICAQENALYIKNNYVNGLSDTLLSSKPVFVFERGAKVFGKKTDLKWARVYNPIEPMDSCYILSRDIFSESEFVALAEKDTANNARTNYELQKYFLRKKEFTKAEKVALGQIKNHPSCKIQFSFEGVNAAGPLAYSDMQKRNKDSTNFADTAVFRFTKTVISITNDSVVMAIAFVDQARCYILLNEPEKAEKILFMLLTDFPDHLIIDACPTEYDSNTRYYALNNMGNLFFVLHQLLNSPARTELFERLNSFQKSNNKRVICIAREISKRIVAGSYWPLDSENEISN